MVYIALTYFFSPFLYLFLFFKEREVKRILVIQTAKIGDLICSTPVFRAIKKRYPDAHLSVMINPLTRELLEHNPNVNEIIPVEGSFSKGFAGKVRLVRLVYSGRYDIGVSLNPNTPFLLTMFWGLVPIRISIMPDPCLKPAGTSFAGITYKLASVFSTYLEKHHRGRLVAETCMQMLKAIDINNLDISKGVFKSPDADDKVERLLDPIPNTQDPRPKVGLAVTSGNRLKEWGAKNMAALADKLITEKNSSVVLIGSDKDKDVSDEILKLTVYKEGIINTVGKFSLQELPALIERLSLLIGVDTGIIYMADALDIPVVDIAGPSDMEDQRPTGKIVTIIQKKDMVCVPCSHTFSAPYKCRYGHRDCIVSVSMDEVFDSAKRLLSRT